MSGRFSSSVTKQTNKNFVGSAVHCGEMSVGDKILSVWKDWSVHGSFRKLSEGGSSLVGQGKVITRSPRRLGCQVQLNNGGQTTFGIDSVSVPERDRVISFAPRQHVTHIGKLLCLLHVSL